MSIVAAVGKWTFDVVYVKFVLLCVYSDLLLVIKIQIKGNSFKE